MDIGRNGSWIDILSTENIINYHQELFDTHKYLVGLLPDYIAELGNSRFPFVILYRGISAHVTNKDTFMFYRTVNNHSDITPYLANEAGMHQFVLDFLVYSSVELL